jgi:transcriptional regulator with XRE-family HTH domain
MPLKSGAVAGSACEEIDMDIEVSFGVWLRRRRRLLDLTQAELAQRVGCAVVTIRKLEADELRSSKHLAERLAQFVEVIPAEYERFTAFVRSTPPAPVADALPVRHTTSVRQNV